MGSWYWIGVAAGIGIGLLIGAWPEAAAGGIGALLGTLSSVPIVSAALRGGGTPLGLAVLVALAGLILAGIAFIPIVGYLEAVVVPVYAYRLSRRGPDRHAGLRILAKD